MFQQTKKMELHIIAKNPDNTQLSSKVEAILHGAMVWGQMAANGEQNFTYMPIEVWFGGKHLLASWNRHLLVIIRPLQLES